ncbi:MAG: hypothetical protein ACI8WP_000737 [Flavobacteriaceae bacterium]|jgi:hypothetical protein
MIDMKRIAFCLFLSIAFSNTLLAQTANKGGNWSADSVWVGGTSPGITGLQTPTVSIVDSDPSDDDYEELVASSLTFRNANARSLTVTSGYLVVLGDVTFSAGFSNASLTVSSGATLIIFGSLNMGKNQAAGSINGTLVVKGSISATNTGNTFGGTGSIYSDGTTSNITGGTITTLQPIDSLSVDGLGPIEEYINGGAGTPLPVNLLSFDLEVNNGVTITWSTVSEKDNDYFVIERSEDGKSFYPVAEIDGNGTTQTLSNYQYTDYSPQANVSFYRLLQVDYDGAFEYFPAKRIEITANAATNRVDIYPTLVTQGKANLVGEYPLYIENAYLYDLRGGKVDNVKNNLSSDGIFRYSLDVSGFTNGVYLLKFTDTKGDSFTKKFIIQD